MNQNNLPITMKCLKTNLDFRFSAIKRCTKPYFLNRREKNYILRNMEIHVTHEYEMEMCLDNSVICEPFEINFPHNFKLLDVDIEAAEEDSLAHICSVSVLLDGEQVYKGMIGGGFAISVDKSFISSLKIIPDCNLLNKLVEIPPSCKIKVSGQYFQYGEPDFDMAFSDEWC